MIHHNQILRTKLGKNFVICVNLAKTLAEQQEDNSTPALATISRILAEMNKLTSIC